MSEAQAEAMVRKKKKRILHNFMLILLIDVALGWACVSIIPVAFVFIFSTPYLPAVLLTIWAVNMILYSILSIMVKRENRKAMENESVKEQFLVEEEKK